VSPGGGTVFISAATHSSADGGSPPLTQYFTTIAYSTRAGVIRWISKYKGPAYGNDTPAALTVSPDGKQVFVTGSSQGVKSNLDYATVAYAAATGRAVWTTRYNGPSNRADTATSMTIALGGRLVIVTGTSNGRETHDDYATVAYAAATGRQVWVERYNDPENRADIATAIVAGPGGRFVYVTGTSFAPPRQFNFATVSYDAATGAQRWVSRYAGLAGDAWAGPIAASTDGSEVFVAGRSKTGPKPNSGDDFATVAFQS
jgi:hypothetical protein